MLELENGQIVNIDVHKEAVSRDMIQARRDEIASAVSELQDQLSQCELDLARFDELANQQSQVDAQVEAPVEAPVTEPVPEVAPEPTPEVAPEVPAEPVAPEVAPAPDVAPEQVAVDPQPVEIPVTNLGSDTPGQ